MKGVETGVCQNI